MTRGGQDPAKPRLRHWMQIYIGLMRNGSTDRLGDVGSRRCLKPRHGAALDPKV